MSKPISTVSKTVDCEDTSLIYKAEISINLDGNQVTWFRSDTGLGGEGEPTDVGFDKILRDFSGVWEFSNYNEPAQIQLPQEALNAQSAGNRKTEDNVIMNTVHILCTRNYR